MIWFTRYSFLFSLVSTSRRTTTTFLLRVLAVHTGTCRGRTVPRTGTSRYYRTSIGELYFRVSLDGGSKRLGSTCNNIGVRVWRLVRQVQWSACARVRHRKQNTSKKRWQDYFLAVRLRMIMEQKQHINIVVTLNNPRPFHE